MDPHFGDALIAAFRDFIERGLEVGRVFEKIEQIAIAERNYARRIGEIVLEIPVEDARFFTFRNNRVKLIHVDFERFGVVAKLPKSKLQARLSE